MTSKKPASAKEPLNKWGFYASLPRRRESSALGFSDLETLDARLRGHDDLTQTFPKRAAPPRASDYTRSFLKDWERLSRSGRYDMKRLKEAMLWLIADEAPLGPEWLDHPFKGDWSDHRECHIGGDFLLIYRVEGNAIVFVRAGSHSGLFEE